MAILKRLIYLIPLLALAGCYEDFTPEIHTKPVLCINSLITAGEPVEVSVSHTWCYTDMGGEQNHEVTDACVYVYVNGVEQKPGYIAQEGDEILISATSQTYGTATASVKVPESVPIDKLVWDLSKNSVWESYAPGWPMNTDLSFNLDAHVTVSDPANEVNYYQLSFKGETPDVSVGSDEFNREKVSLDTGTFKYEAEPIFSEHIGMLDAISGNDAYGFTFFTDRRFSGNTYTLHLLFDSMRYTVCYPEYDEALFDCNVTFTLSSISESYYNWANYKWQTGEGLIGDLGNIGLGDPVWGYSNVSTGAGIVAARSQTTYTIPLYDFLSALIKP